MNSVQILAFGNVSYFKIFCKNEMVVARFYSVELHFTRKEVVFCQFESILCIAKLLVKGCVKSVRGQREATRRV